MTKTDLSSIVNKEKIVTIAKDFKEGLSDGLNQWQYFYVHGKTSKKEIDLDNSSNGYQWGWFASMPVNVPSLGLMLFTGFPFGFAEEALVEGYYKARDVVQERKFRQDYRLD